MCVCKKEKNLDVDPTPFTNSSHHLVYYHNRPNYKVCNGKISRRKQECGGVLGFDNEVFDTITEAQAMKGVDTIPLYLQELHPGPSVDA